jgi:hypothetical protein
MICFIHFPPHFHMLIQAEHSRCAAELLARCDRETSEPEFSGIPGFPLISLCRQLVRLLPPEQVRVGE